MDPELIVNPFEDDIAIDPRRIDKPVPGLNDRVLQKLIASFSRLTRDPLPRRDARLPHAQLVISPEAGYGKSHLIGRVFQKLEGAATRINIQPFEDSDTPWKSILDRIVHELKAPEQTQSAELAAHQATQLHYFAHGVIAHLVADMVDTGQVSAKQPKADVVKALRDGKLASFREARTHGKWPQTVAKLFSQPDSIQAMAECVEVRGIELWTKPYAWLRVLFTYAWSDNRSLRTACLDWLRGESMDDEDAKAVGLKPADCPRPDRTEAQLNDLCMNRILDLCRLAGFYRPFVLCFDQTENYGKDPVLAKSLGTCIDVITRQGQNEMTIFTANETPWADAIRVHWQGAHSAGLSPPLELEGLDRTQARDLVTMRLEACQILPAHASQFLTGGKWIGEFFGQRDRIGIRAFLKFCGKRWENVHLSPLPPPPLEDLFREYCDKVASQPRRMEFNRDVLRWLVQDLAKGLAGIEITQVETKPGQRLLCWHYENREILFGFEAGYDWQRWIKIAEATGKYCDKHPRAKIVYLRTPELVPIPRPGRWPTIGPRIEEAKRRFLHILPLYPEEVKLVYAAYELHSEVVQGDVEVPVREALDFLRGRLDRLWERIKEPSHPEPQPPPQPPDEELPGRVRSIVKRERFLSLDELLQRLEGRYDRDAVLAACGSVPEIAMHHSPAMVVLQWQGRLPSAS